MSPGVTGGRARWPVGPEKISAHHFFCFCSRLCRHLDPVSLQHMLPRREDYSSSKCKINTSEVTDAPSSQAERFWVSSQRGSQDRRERLCSQQKGCSVCMMERRERETHRGAVHLQDRWCCITYVHDCVQPLVLCCFLICSSSQDKKIYIYINRVWKSPDNKEWWVCEVNLTKRRFSSSLSSRWGILLSSFRPLYRKWWSMVEINTKLF